MTMTDEIAARIYKDLRRLWLSTADPASKEEAEREFDGFVGNLMERGARAAQQGITSVQAEPCQHPEGFKCDNCSKHGKPAEAEIEEISQSRMMMEIILEIDTTMNMVPPRVKKYRDLLAAEGLDKTSDVTGNDGQKGLAGINLADQAALEFHKSLLGISISIAHAEALDRLNKPMADTAEGQQ